MIVVVCLECLREMDPFEYGASSFDELEGAEVKCRHCDAILIVHDGDVELKVLE